MEENLWNEIEKTSEYYTNKELYQNHILEQYKLYTESADKISSRRNLTNVFFLTINTTILGILGFTFENFQTILSTPLLVLLTTTFLVLCIVWWWILRSYRNLNSAKFKVVGQLEKKLPASPYWSAEWNHLGSGRDIKKYLPLSFLEQFVPIIFLILYVLLAYFLGNC